MSNNGLYTDGTENFGPKVNSIPLSDVDTTRPGETSIGQLVSNASEQISSLVRAEVELAKTEIAASAKKGGIGAGLFGAAGVMALYASLFFFIFLAELLTLWLDRWASYLIVFLLLIAVAGVLVGIGIKQIKKVKKPEKTIESVNELKHLVPGKASATMEKRNRGLYT
ncbi:MAG: phage holin family protein [Corynebacterium sp.]|nr:phage holin family protein [Corynebacterium sp.]